MADEQVQGVPAGLTAEPIQGVPPGLTAEPIQQSAPSQEQVQGVPLGLIAEPIQQQSQQFKPGDMQQKPGGPVTNVADIPTSETSFYTKHPANVLYRDIRSKEVPAQTAARQATAQAVDQRIMQPVRTDDLMTPEQQKAHPITAGALDIATGFITPENIGIMAATEGLGTLAGPSLKLAAEVLPRLVSAGFTIQQIWGAAKESNELWDAIKSGDQSTALRLTTHIVGDLGFAALGAQHATGIEARPSTAIGRSIDRAIDTGTTRFAQAFKSDIRAMATASAKHEAAITAYEQRYDEQSQMSNQAHRASQNAQAVKEAFENGNATQQQLDDANTAASKAASGLRKATQALADAHEARSQAAVEVDRMTRKMARNQGKTSEAESNIVAGRKEDFKSAIPATRRGPAAYNDRDLDIGMGYLDQHHMTVQPVESVQDAYDAFDHAQKDIESKVRPYVEKYANEPNPVNVRMYVHDQLSKNPNVHFVEDGMNELENYNLRDPNIAESDDIRANLNAMNRPVFGRDPVDVMTRLETDPKFAARYYAAEALRKGEYDLFRDKKVQGIEEARRDEASIIKLKMAAERQIGKGDVKVRGSGQSGKLRQAAQWAAHKVGVGVGASIGAELGPAGAAAGAALGDVLTDRQSKLGRLISPTDETRDALIQRHMKYAGKGGVPVTEITGVGEPATTLNPSTPVSPRMDLYTPQREQTQLHADLATHYGEDMDTPYLDLEQRFREDIADKKRHNVPLEPDEKTLLGKINSQDALDRAAAEKQQAEDLVNGNKPAVPNYPEHMEPIMQAPGANLAPGMDTHKGIVHDIAHAVVGAARGINFTGGIRSHLHSDSQAHGAVMEAPIDWTPFLNEDGDVDPQKLKSRMADIAATYVAGGVANDLYHDIPFTENHNLGADVRILKRYMRQVGFTDAEASKMIAQAADDAASILNNHEVQDMIERHASVREGGLDSKFHVSPERLEQIIQDVKDAANENTTTGKSGGVAQSGKQQLEKPIGSARPGPETEATAEPEKGNTAVVRSERKGLAGRKGEESQDNEPKPKSDDIKISGTPPQLSPNEQAKKTVEEQGLNYKGELMPGSDVHMFEHPDHPGKTAALQGPLTADAVRDKMQSKLREFGVGSKDATAEQLATHEREGGSTFTPTGENLTKKDAYSVGSYPERTTQVDKLTPEILNKFKTDNADLLSKPDHAVGTWKDPDTGKTVLDISRIYPDREQAIAAGKQKNQKAIYNLRTGEEIPTGGTGENIKPQSPQLSELDKWLEEKSGYHPDLQALIKLTRTLSRDPADVKRGGAFITPDGQISTMLPGQQHPETISRATGATVNGAVDNRPEFLDRTGAVRTRFTRGRDGDRLSVSVPKTGVTQDQADMIRQAVGSIGRNGNLLLERSDTSASNDRSAHKEFATPRDVEPMLRKIGALPGQNQEKAPADMNRAELKTALGITGDDPRNGMSNKYFQSLLEKQRGIKPESPQLGIPESRVSTRVPSGKNATENHLEGSPLEIDRAALENSPQKLQDKFADKMRDLPGMKIPKNITDSGKIYDRAIRHIADNLKFLYSKVPAAVREANAKWYESAHGLAQRRSAEHGYTPEQTAGVIASLSPQTEWDTNVSLAKRLTDIHKNHMDETVTPEMIQKGQEIVQQSRKGKAKDTNKYLKSVLDDINGKKLSELSGLQQAAAVRLYDEIHNPREFRRIDPATGNEMEIRTNADGTPSKANWGNLKNIGKALSILSDGSRENISNQVGEAHKVRNFYNNIIDPSNPNDVTIDTHAVGAATLVPMNGNTKEVVDNFGAAGGNKATGIKGTYPLYADGYRLAAKELGIKTRELQSVIWEEIRNMFPAEWKRKENLDRVRNEWKKYTDGEQSIDKTRENIYQIGEQAKAKIEQARAAAQAKAKTAGKPISALDFLKLMKDNKAGVQALGGEQ